MDIDVQEACHQLSEVKIDNRKESNSPERGVSEHVEKTQDNDVDHDELNKIQIKYNRLVTKAKQLTGEGQIRAALELNQRALKLHHNEKLAKRISKMEAYLKEHGDESSEDDSGMVHVGNGFHLYRDFYDKLYAHQREGVSWLWGLYRQRKGGILGDDMGLGKTIQIIAFLSGLFDMQKVHAALLVMPVSVMVNWEKEFKKWAPGIRVNLYHGNSKREKERSLAKVQRRGGVCITSYGLVVTSWKLLSEQDGREFRWDYLILDEGHKIKNPTKTTKGVQAIGARNRLILTGTPVQNNLKELWALFDFVHQGTLLGTARTFKMEFENPITRARERDATAGERRLGMEMAEGLKHIIAPYFLRRTKAEVKEKEAKKGTDEKDSAIKMPTMTRKNDLIVWLYLTPTQQQIYEDFLSLDSVKELLMTSKSPLVALTVLKKICDHPRLLSTRACAQLGLDGEDGMDESELDTPEAHQCAANQINHIEDDVLIKESGKLIVLVELLDNLKLEGHRCLLFSQSRKILDIIAKIVKNRGHKVMRLDGTVTSIEERDQRIKKFQSDDSYSVFLLTTQVGGVGLTLTAADRVIIFDPSWNPATDEQAVDRVFRIGQDKNVVIYRLITCGTVEEKIYRRQIFKDSITRQTTGSTKNPYRYFTKQELRELFTLDSPRCSTTQQQLEEMHSSNRKTDQSLDAHIAFLYSLDIFGISDHDLMFTQDHTDQKRDDEMDDETSETLEGNDYIQHRVQKARELIQMESSVSTTFNLQEQVKAPRIGEPRTQNWTGPQVTFPKTEEPEFKEEPEDDQGNLSTSCVDLTSPDNSIHDSSPTASEQASNNSVISISESPFKDENSKFVKIEPLSPNIVRSIKSEIESIPQNNDDLLHKDETETVSPCPKPRIKTEPESPIVCDEDDSETKLPVLSHKVKTELASPAPVSYQSPKLNEYKSPQVLKSTPPRVLDYQSFEENKENMSPVLHRSKQLNSPRLQKENYNLKGGETNDIQTPSRREKRISVSKSPWLAQTPKLENKNVIEEEIFISPDAARPLVKTEPKLNFKSPLAVKNFSRLNSTLMSAFSSDSPDVYDRSGSSAGGSVSDSPPQSRLGMTFVGESPEPKQDPLYTTFVGDSPSIVNKLKDKSRIGNLANVLKVVDSTQNTPVSLSAQSSIHGENSSNTEEVCVAESTDDESSPQKSFTDSPLHTVKNRQKIRKAVIESSDEENGINSDDESHKVDAIKNSDSESEERVGESDEISDMENEKSVSESDNQEVSNSDNELQEDKSVSNKKKHVIASSDSDMDTDDAPKNVRKSDIKNHLDSHQSDDDHSVDSDNSSVDNHRNKTDKKKAKSLSKSSFIDGEVESDNKGMSKSRVSDGDEEEVDDTDLSGFVVDDDEEITEEEEDSESASDVDDESSEGEDSGGDDKEKDDFDKLPKEMKKQFKELTEVGRSLYKSGQYEEAMAYILQALEIYPDTSLQVLALKLNKKISE